MSHLTKVKVLSEFDAPQTIVGFEILYLGNTSYEYKSPGTFGYTKSEEIDFNWLTITSDNDLLTIDKDGVLYEVTLPQGKALNPFYVAHRISQQLKPHASCEFVNNSFIIWSDDVDDDISVFTSPYNDNDATIVLGFGSPTTVAGTSVTNTYSGNVSASGTYTGLSDDIYWIVVSGNSITSVTPGSNNVYQGSVTVAGAYRATTNTTYTITIDTTNGNIAEAGIGYVPTFSVSSTDTDDSPTDKAILVYNAWYEIGDKGLRIKFSEHPFGHNDTFQIDCLAPQTADGTNNTANEIAAKFVVMSLDGINTSPVTLISGNLLLPKGITISFTSGTFEKGDLFVLKAYPDNFEEVNDLRLGIVDVGYRTDWKPARLIIKEGMMRFRFCKVGRLDNGDLVEVDYGGTEPKLGVLGKDTVSNNNNEVLTTGAQASVSLSDFYYYLDFWEEGYYVDLGTDIFSSSPFYMLLETSDNEVTMTTTINLGFYYNYS